MNMRNLLILTVIFIVTISDVYSYALKVYDDYGNRVGTYRKVGDSYEFYDFYDNKVEKAEDIIKNAPTQQTLSDVERRFYDGNMLPIDTYNTEVYGTRWRNYPRRYPRTNFINMPREPYIVRPRSKKGFLYNGGGYYHPHSFNKSINIIH